MGLKLGVTRKGEIMNVGANMVRSDPASVFDGKRALGKRLGKGCQPSSFIELCRKQWLCLKLGAFKKPSR